MSISEMMAKDPAPRASDLEQDISRWVEREISLGGPSVPDFWDECQTSERLAAFLTRKGWTKSDGARVRELCDALTTALHTVAEGMDAINELQGKVAWYEDKLAEANKALMDIRRITGQTHTGQPRAYTALSQIDMLARVALA